MNSFFPHLAYRKGACLSPCRKYRYTLSRAWGDNSRPLVVIGLNPSKADESKDDNTIKKLVTIARGLNFDTLIMLNLFAFRATDPREMKNALDPVGPDNDEILKSFISGASTVVAAWGNHGSFRKRDAFVVTLAKTVGKKLYCFDITSQGQPKHPLFLPNDTRSLYPFNHKE